jgi:hypothetical protein
MQNSKFTPMIGMFHDNGQSTKLFGNVAAGSERSGYTGYGISYYPNTASDVPNEAMSCLVGYWFGGYNATRTTMDSVRFSNFIFWKMYLYAIYGEISNTASVIISDIAVADARVGVRILMSWLSTGFLVDKRVNISSSLFVGASRNNNGCMEKSPSLYTCMHRWVYCEHLNEQV